MSFLERISSCLVCKNYLQCSKGFPHRLLSSMIGCKKSDFTLLVFANRIRLISGLKIEAAVGRCFSKDLFFKNVQYSQETPFLSKVD